MYVRKTSLESVMYDTKGQDKSHGKSDSDPRLSFCALLKSMSIHSGKYCIELFLSVSSAALYLLSDEKPLHV